MTRLLLAAACPAALAASLACAGKEARTVASALTEQDTALRTSISCPHDAEFTIRIPHDSDSVHYSTMPVSGPISNVPEYHDCQRLLRDTSSRFGPLVGIWASWKLPEERDSLRGLRGGVAIAAAEIFSWDGAYEPLGIRRYFNCLYMRFDSTPREGQWRAWMVPMDTNGAGCLKSYVPGSQAETELAVAPTTRGRPHEPGDVPPVARWDWNPRNRTQTIGIMCAPDWCIVGQRDGFDTGPGYSLSSVPEIQTIPQAKRVLEVRGWYDEQRLDPATGPKPNASGVFATVFPHPALLHYRAEDFPTRRFLPTAFVVIRAGTRPGDDAVLGQYLNKYNFAVGVNQIALCAGNPQTCVPPGITAPACVIDAPDEAWTARITSPGRQVKYMCVRKCTTSTRAQTLVPPLAVSGPGTARWRWQAQDVTLWTSCPRGCCQLVP